MYSPKGFKAKLSKYLFSNPNRLFLVILLKIFILKTMYHKFTLIHIPKIKKKVKQPLLSSMLKLKIFWQFSLEAPGAMILLGHFVAYSQPSNLVYR
jgi:hypothetical protein